MYQFYYSENKPYERGLCNGNVKDYIEIESIKPSMWEEHCLECSAPLCYKNCLNYVARSDGRCKRFDNSFQVYQSDKACCGKATHIKFRKWANMMTIVFQQCYQ